MRTRAIQPRRQSGAGFTLVEMLVVIGIIVLLVGIAVPMLNRAYKNAVRARMAADLQVIQAGLEAYRQDFKDYPRLDYISPPPPAGNPRVSGISLIAMNGQSVDVPGAVLLCWSLVGVGPDKQDGADGPGFRTRAFADPNNSAQTIGQGQVYGPYIAVNRFNFANMTDDSMATINDRYGHPYLYFPANKTSNPRNANGFVMPWQPGNGNNPPMFNANDGVAAFRQSTETDDVWATKRLQGVMGDRDFSGNINGSEAPAFAGPYLLWGAGPDEVYGPPFISGSTTQLDYDHLDDVAASP